MNYYIGKKLIMATPAVKAFGDASTIGQEGYSVKYIPDEYTSWSPKGPFDAAYVQLQIDISGLEQWQQRVVAEKTLLDNDLTKLQNWIKTPMFESLSDEQKNLFVRQEKAMSDYSAVLAERIALF